MITPGTESRRTPKRQRRLASAATLVIGLLLVLSGCGDDQGDCVNCPQGAGDFRPGLYRLATSITVCGSGETFLEHEELIAHCNEGPIGGALPCDYTLDGTTLTMDCTIADYPFGTVGSITASIGAAELAAGDDLASWLARADVALYQAKRSGRNSVRPG